MRLFKGENAPAFSAVDLSGREIRLSDLKGRKIFLTFLRGASCPFCNLRVHELIQRKDEFAKRNIEVILFFTSDAAEIAKYVGKQESPYTIIPDPEGKHYVQFGVESSFTGMMIAMFRMKSWIKIFKHGFFSLKSALEKNTIPADILIDAHGVISIAYYGNDFGDHLPLEQIFEVE